MRDIATVSLGSVVFIAFCYLLVSAWSNAVNLTDGVAGKFKAVTDKLLASTGYFASKDKLLQNALKLNEKEVQSVEDRASGVETNLKARYTALDSQMSKLNALNAYIAQQVTTWNKSSG